MQRRIGVLVLMCAVALALWLVAADRRGTAGAPAGPWRALLPFAGSRAVGVPPTSTAVPTIPTAAEPTGPTPWPEPSSAPSPTARATPSPPPQLEITGLRCMGRHEVVRIANAGGESVDMADWRLHSVIGAQELVFPAFTLGPGRTVGIHSGPDAPPDDAEGIRWTRGYRWNNGGDEAVLLDPDGFPHASRECDDVPPPGASAPAKESNPRDAS